jgi:hypothetical protein
MKIQHNVLSGMIAAALIAGVPAAASTIPNATGVPTQLVVTVLPSHGSQPGTLKAGDVTVRQGNNSAPVIRLQRLAGDLADMQLFILLDDSTRSSVLGIHLAELKKFVEALPPTTQVAIGYMRNGTFGPVQEFTSDHQKAAAALRLPESIPGGNGSPYFALSDLAKHWPSKQSTNRRAVLMLTDGVDRYYGDSMVDDPYVDASIRDALKEGVMVYSIYLRGSGLYGRGAWPTNYAQSRLMDVSHNTGGYAYFEDFTDPVSISPFLTDFQERLDNQYQVTIEDVSKKGVQPVKVRTEVPGLKIEAPTHVYVP